MERQLLRLVYSAHLSHITIVRFIMQNHCEARISFANLNEPHRAKRLHHKTTPYSAADRNRRIWYSAHKKSKKREERVRRCAFNAIFQLWQRTRIEVICQHVWKNERAPPMHVDNITFTYRWVRTRIHMYIYRERERNAFYTFGGVYSTHIDFHFHATSTNPMERNHLAKCCCGSCKGVRRFFV